MWKISNKNENEAEIFLYDEISDYNYEEAGYISAKGLINAIKELGNIKSLTLRINSSGGDVFQAQAMYNYLKSCKANIIVKIDGIAASAASLVAMAGDKIIMPENALIMIHNPVGGCYGEAEDLTKLAEILEKVRDTIAAIYVAKTGLSREKIIDLMDCETWLNAKEAKELNFCDEIEESVKIAAIAKNDGLIFKNILGYSKLDKNLCEKLPENAVKINTIQNNTEVLQNKMENKITNFQELEKAYPEFVASIRENAVKDERERLRILDSLCAEGCEEIIEKAKYEEPKDARDIAIELLRAQKTQAKLNALRTDASAINDVLRPEKTQSISESEKNAAVNAVLNEINKLRGVK